MPKNEIINIPKQYKFLSEFIPKLPSHKLINKGITGCGGTTLELNAERNSIILCPTKNLVLNKAKYGIGITGNTLNKDINTYLKTASIKYKKIIATYDALPRLMELIPDYYNYFLLVDEYHLLFNDYGFRNKAILYILKHFREFNDWCFLTATPIKPEFILSELSDIDTITYNWKGATLVNTQIKDTPFIQKELLSLIDYYKNKCNLHIFINSVDTIRNIIKKLDTEDYRVICATTNKGKILHFKDVNSKVCKLNFYTSCAFEGVDIYDKDGRCIIICDSNVSTTMLDISTKIRQICGRIRDSKYKNECTIILNTKKHRYAGTTKEDFIKRSAQQEIYGKIAEEEFNDRVNKLNKALELNDQFLIKKCKDAINGELDRFSDKCYDQYLNKFDNKIFFDINLKNIDFYNYNLISEIYNDQISVLSELQSNGFKPKPLKVKLSNNYITIKEGVYTYQQLKDEYESYLLDNFGIKWNNRTIGKYFPEHIKKSVRNNREVVKVYIFKKEL